MGDEWDGDDMLEDMHHEGEDTGFVGSAVDVHNQMLLDMQYGDSAINPTAESKTTNYAKYCVRLKDDRLTPIIQSVCVSFELGTTLIFEDLVPRIRVLEFTPSRFGSATLFLNCPQHSPPLKARARLTAKGHVSVTGLKTVDSAIYIAKKICKLFRKVGERNARVLNFRVTNMLGITDLSLPVRLDEFHKAHPEWCTYEPETFPALRLRMLNPKCGVHIFVNGKINVLGLRSQHMGQMAMERVLPLLKPYLGTGSPEYNEQVDEFFKANTEGPAEVVEGFKEVLLEEDIVEMNENKPSFVHDLLKKGDVVYHVAPKSFAKGKNVPLEPANEDDLDCLKADSSPMQHLGMDFDDEDEIDHGVIEEAAQRATQENPINGETGEEDKTNGVKAKVEEFLLTDDDVLQANFPDNVSDTKITLDADDDEFS